VGTNVVTTYSIESATGTSVTLTSEQLKAGIIAIATSLPTGDSTTITFPTPASMINAGFIVGNIYTIFISNYGTGANHKIGFAAAQPTNCTVIGNLGGVADVSLKQILIMITSSTTYTVYV
jgi:hypothetical protein